MNIEMVTQMSLTKDIVEDKILKPAEKVARPRIFLFDWNVCSLFYSVLEFLQGFIFLLPGLLPLTHLASVSS